MIKFFSDKDLLNDLDFCDWKSSIKYDQNSLVDRYIYNSNHEKEVLDLSLNNPQWNYAVSGQTGSGKTVFVDESIKRRCLSNALTHIASSIEMWHVLINKKVGGTHESKRKFLEKNFSSIPITEKNQECSWLAKINKHYYLLTLTNNSLSIKTEKIEFYYRAFDMSDLAEHMGIKNKITENVKDFMSKERLKYKIENIE